MQHEIRKKNNLLSNSSKRRVSKPYNGRAASCRRDVAERPLAAKRTPLYSFLPHSFILYIILYSLWGPLITLSKYIHLRSSFEEFIKTNSMVQSEFNCGFWFVSYNIFYRIKTVGPAAFSLFSVSVQRARA
jgi:hypothetical protein